MMLREYRGDEDLDLVQQAVKQFIPLPAGLRVVDFGDVSPDSFIWMLTVGHSVYYLYAEDYVPSLDHVRKTILEFIPEGSYIDLIPAIKERAFEDTSPNKIAEVYQPPDDESRLSRYAGQSGFDYVFLAKALTR